MNSHSLPFMFRRDGIPGQGEGWGGDGVIHAQSRVFRPIPLPASPLKGEELIFTPLLSFNSHRNPDELRSGVKWRAD